MQTLLALGGNDAAAALVQQDTIAGEAAAVRCHVMLILAFQAGLLKRTL